jgi:excisionase family DNA binding protein
MPEREWYSTQQVAQVVGMTSQWVRRQIDAGRLNARYFEGAGRRTYRIHRTDLRDFLRRFGRDSVDNGDDLLGPRRR